MKVSINLILYYMFPIIVIFDKGRRHEEHPKAMVLLVDDDQKSARLNAEALEQSSYSVKTVRDPAKALKEFSTHSAEYQAVIVSARMSGMTGFEFARSVRKHRPEGLCSVVTEAVGVGPSKNRSTRCRFMTFFSGSCRKMAT